MSRPFYSLIIPCHNSYTIRRVMDSIGKQGISKDDIEIIIIDDDSNDKSYLDIVNSYDYNVIFSQTNTDVHCPGNTRREGMKYVSGKWLCFCDHDDYFVDGALGNMKKMIETSTKNPCMINSVICSYNEETKSVTQYLSNKAAWLHGKFYNVDKFIKKYNINFKKDLITHEDVYFNSLCFSKIYEFGLEMYTVNALTYRWVEQSDSITRSYQSKRGYLFDNFDDYICAASDPYWDVAINKKDPVFINQLVMAVLHSYFYYEAASYYNGPYDYVDVIMSIKKYVDSLVSRINMSYEDIIDFVYSDPEKYCDVRSDCELATSAFIPKTSFRDFMFHLKDR